MSNHVVALVEKKSGINSKKFLAATAGFCTSTMLATPVLAAETGMASISSALNTAFSEITTSMLELVASILPIVLPIVGAITLIKFGISTFKKVTNKSN